MEKRKLSRFVFFSLIRKEVFLLAGAYCRGMPDSCSSVLMEVHIVLC